MWMGTGLVFRLFSYFFLGPSSRSSYLTIALVVAWEIRLFWAEISFWKRPMQGCPRSGDIWLKISYTAVYMILLLMPLLFLMFFKAKKTKNNIQPFDQMVTTAICNFYSVVNDLGFEISLGELLLWDILILLLWDFIKARQRSWHYKLAWIFASRSKIIMDSKEEKTHRSFAKMWFFKVWYMAEN